MTDPSCAAREVRGASETNLLADWLRLALTPGIGPVHGRRLIMSVAQDAGGVGSGLASDIGVAWRQRSFASLAAALGSTPLAAALVAADATRDRYVEETLAWLAASDDHWILTPATAGYPERLLHLADPPLLLYGVGDPAWLSHRQLAVVGSRRATPLGLATARDLACALRSNGWVVTSGLAEGIDRAAHEGALSANDGATVAVVGTGIDLVYPARHRALAGRIRAAGALVTEQPLGMEPIAANFPRRNRLIAALAEGVLVVEAATNSGSLITAQIAAELGRDVFAVPGSIHSPQSRGCHRLLRNGAGLVETLDDILGQYTLQGSPERRGAAGSSFGTGSAGRRRAWADGQRAAGADGSPSELAPGDASAAASADAPVEASDDENRAEPDDSALLACLVGGPVDLDRLQATLGWPVGRLLVQLQLLELQGVVDCDPAGGWFRRP